MDSSNQKLYQPLSRQLDEMNPNSPPPAYDQPLQQTQPQQGTPTTNSVNATIVASAMPPMIIPGMVQVGPHSLETNCPQCRCRIKTKVRHRATSKTHIVCLLLSWTVCCCCLPYCMDSCRNANHFCPMCGTFIGTYQS